LWAARHLFARTTRSRDGCDTSLPFRKEVSKKGNQGQSPCSFLGDFLSSDKKSHSGGSNPQICNSFNKNMHFAGFSTSVLAVFRHFSACKAAKNVLYLNKVKHVVQKKGMYLS
jgi:hypothetical protein